MYKYLSIFVITFLIGEGTLYAQQNKTKELVVADTVKTSPVKINPLAPARAAFLSAIIPGLGQVYNKRYWKVPLVYGAIGTGVYFYVSNDALYNKYRDAYKLRLSGGIDAYKGQYDDATLIRAQKLYQRNRDISLLVTVALYALNIVDANIDAHLKQFNVDQNLSIRPDIITNKLDYNQNVGLTLNYKF